MSVQLPAVRVSEELDAALRARAGRERRSLSSTIRLVLEDALLRSEKAIEGWGKLDEAMRASRSGSAADVSEDRHDFTPQPSNALRCTCGVRKADHR
jgi:hypothetical protein